MGKEISIILRHDPKTPIEGADCRVQKWRAFANCSVYKQRLRCSITPLSDKTPCTCCIQWRKKANGQSLYSRRTFALKRGNVLSQGGFVVWVCLYPVRT